LVGGGIVSVYGWIQVAKLKQYPLAFNDEVALYIQSILFTILTLVSLFGLIGASIKNIGMVSSFATFLAIHLCFSIGIGIYSLVVLFKQNTDDAIRECINNTVDQSTTLTAATQTCQDALSIIKGVTVAVYVVTWLVQLYAYFIVDRYAKQLEDEFAAKDTERMVAQISRPIPAAVTTYATPRPNNGYSFNDPPHSFGGQYRAGGPSTAV
jgi:FtsH-binding integral membrane protein